MRDLTLFDRDEGERLKEEGMERVRLQPGGSEFERIAYRAVESCARSYAEFTTDDVRALLERWGTPDPSNPKILGPVMLRAARARLIRRTDRVIKSSWKLNHRRPVTVWRSCL